MAELALAIIPLVSTATKVVDRAVGFFKRLQNAPDEIRMLRILLAHLNEDLDTLKPYIGPGRQLRDLSTDEKAEIEKALRSCNEFLSQRCIEMQTANMLGRLVWTTAHGGSLNDIKARIERVKPIIDRYYSLLNIALKEDSARITSPPGPPVLGLPVCQSALPTRESDAGLRGPHAERLPSPAPQQHPETEEPDNNQSVPREHVQEVQESLREPRLTRLRDVLDTGAVAIDPRLRNLCGSTLHLSDQVPHEYRKLRLEELEVAARDEESTLLRFRCNGGAFGVKHLILFKTLPRISDITSSEVSFLAEHAITVIRSDGQHLFHVKYPRYSFANRETRKVFQELVRGRKLLAEFEATEIRALATHDVKTLGIKGWRDRVIAQGEPLQVWSIDRPGCRVPVVKTMTFVARIPGVEDKYDHLEVHFDDLSGEVLRVESEASRKRKRKTVQGRWVVPGLRSDGVRITFQDEKEARRFEKLFQPPDPDPSHTNGHGPHLHHMPVASRLAPTIPLVNIEPGIGLHMLFNGIERPEEFRRAAP